MPPSRRDFLLTTAAASALRPAVSAYATELDGWQIAARNRIVRNGATPDFFEGMLLGNGDIGVVVTVRPDALGLHIGKSDSWDIRVDETHADKVLTFSELLNLWQRASAEARRLGKPDMTYLEREIPFFREYTDQVTASYSKIWPRPWPCGIVWIHWDATHFEVARQELNPANGAFQLTLLHAGQTVHLHVFVNTTTGHVCVWSEEPAPFASISYAPNLDAQAHLLAPAIDARVSPQSAEFTAYQRFPATAPTMDQRDPPPSSKDRCFALHGIVSGHWNLEGLEESKRQLQQFSEAKDTYTWYEERPRVFLKSAQAQQLRIDIAVFTPRDHTAPVAQAASEARRLSSLDPPRLQSDSDAYWRDYWSRSAVEFEDEELEALWVHNQYWLACCLRQGKVAPGLFGNWTSGRIGTAWHGDYHMNYNTQQVFWGVFSSNHADQHFPYIELIENLMPLSARYAHEKFDLPGGYFPHSAYPVPSQVVPYPTPPWGYEFCETPWAVQSLWWHYLYTRDHEVLQRVYPPLRAAARFIAAYMKLGDDGLYHFRVTVSPENWGCTVDYRLNQDCIMDLALTRFLLEAVVQASEELGVDSGERTHWNDVRQKLAPYPKAEGPDGEVWLDVPHAPVGWIYNIPVTLAPVFPGEQVGLGLQEDQLPIARRTAASVRLEGGNDVVLQPLIRARLGMLDLDWFKKEVRYCRMPNGIIQDRVRQVGGRYKDSTDFDFMLRMGVWTENLSLPCVLNECMLQSYAGTVRVFPNTIHLGPARFQNLRAAGAFLVSASWDGRRVSPVDILSEKGGTVRLASPWGEREISVLRLSDRAIVLAERSQGVLEFDAGAGLKYRVSPVR
jgi:alpha-L-fucosidase 2